MTATQAPLRLLVTLLVVVAALAAPGVVGPWTAGSAATPTHRASFEDGSDAVTRLDPALLDALRRADADAPDGLRITSGWRSAAHQERLLREAVARYGSWTEAARWVATPETSAHVSGDAVDVGPADAIAWIARHGARYGLCQIYRNEPWHVELRPDAVDHGCPAMYADPTHDPRTSGATR